MLTPSSSDLPFDDSLPAQPGAARQPVVIVAQRHGPQLVAQLPAADFSIVQAAPEQARSLLERRGGLVVVVDCRGALNEGIRAVEAIGDLVRTSGSALVAIVRHADQTTLPTLYTLGVTHILAAPFSSIELVHALRFASRMTDRLRGRDASAISQTESVRTIDSITGLATEAFARQRIDEIMESGNQNAALIVISLSRFNRMNSQFGRTFVDKLLRTVAQRLQRLVIHSTQHMPGRGRRHAVRLGGAEFAVLLEAPVDLRDAVALAQHLVDIFSKPFVIGGTLVHLSCRLGIANTEDEQETSDSLFQKAAQALDSLRLQATNSFAVYDPSASNALPSRPELEAGLRAALRDGQISVAYQPLVDLTRNSITGFESLVRWSHPALGPLSAEAIISLATEAELLPQLGRNVLTAALTAGKHWHTAIAVNIAPAQFHQPDFETWLRQTLEQIGFQPHLLTLEITESALIDDFDLVASTMLRLKKLGLRLAIDDFGTGHASYGYLKQLPFDYLKIDRSFIDGLARDRRDRAMVRSIIEMARTLGMAVIAEGVESPEQVDILRQEGCTAYQGYLCSEPLAAADVPRFLETWTQSPDKTG